MEVFAALSAGSSGNRGTMGSLTPLDDQQGSAEPTVAERQINDGESVAGVPA